MCVPFVTIYGILFKMHVFVWFLSRSHIALHCIIIMQFCSICRSFDRLFLSFQTHHRAALQIFCRCDCIWYDRDDEYIEANECHWFDCWEVRQRKHSLGPAPAAFCHFIIFNVYVSESEQIFLYHSTTVLLVLTHATHIQCN